jgi:putative photosynthetic complex assembly protein
MSTAHTAAMTKTAGKAWGPDSFPTWVLYCAGALIAFSLISVGLVRITGNGPDQRAAAAVSERTLRFEDRSDGGVAVFDGENGQLIAVLQGEKGFVRGTLRALTRERHSRGIGNGPPFTLTAYIDHRLALKDPATGARIDLESFGPTNMAEFARFLPPTSP